MATILIVEDEPDMAAGLRDNLECEGYDVRIAGDGEEALEAASQVVPDLILLDLMLPRRNGLDVCRELRRRGINVPIIMLTARGEETDKVVGLEIGADDYVTKPFSVRELMARVHVQLRRTASENAPIEDFRFGEVELDFRRQHAARAGQMLHLTAREFDILKYFVRRRGETVSRDELLDARRCRRSTAARDGGQHAEHLQLGAAACGFTSEDLLHRSDIGGRPGVDPIFPSRNGGGTLDFSQVRRIGYAAAKKAGLEQRVSPHWFRHAHASHALDRNAPIHLVQATRGHASVATTGRYLHARPDASSGEYLPE